jgi:hypothetical protein
MITALNIALNASPGDASFQPFQVPNLVLSSRSRSFCSQLRGSMSLEARQSCCSRLLPAVWPSFTAKINQSACVETDRWTRKIGGQSKNLSLKPRFWRTISAHICYDHSLGPSLSGSFFMLPSTTSENSEQVLLSSNELNGPSQQETDISGEQAAGADQKPFTHPETNVQPSNETKEADVKEINIQTSKLQALEAATSTPSPSLTAKGWGLPNASMSMLPSLSLTSWFSSDKKPQEASSSQAGIHTFLLPHRVGKNHKVYSKT